MFKFICYPKCTTCQKAQEWLMKIGAGLLIALMLFATFNDVMRWFK